MNSKDDRIDALFHNVRSAPTPDTWAAVERRSSAGEAFDQDNASARGKWFPVVVLVSTCAVFLVLGFSILGQDDRSETVGLPSAASSAPSTAPRQTDLTSTSLLTPSETEPLATVAPSTASAGEWVSVTPRAAVTPACDGYGGLWTREPPRELLRQLAPNGDASTAPEPTWLACRPAASADPVRLRVPVSADPGQYVLCVTMDYVAEGCGHMNVSG